MHNKAQTDGSWLGSTLSVQMKKHTFAKKHCMIICKAKAILPTQKAHVIILNYTQKFHFLQGKKFHFYVLHFFLFFCNECTDFCQESTTCLLLLLKSQSSALAKLAQAATSLTCMISARVCKNEVLKETMAEITAFERVAHLMLHNNLIPSPI